MKNTIRLSSSQAEMLWARLLAILSCHLLILAAGCSAALAQGAALPCAPRLSSSNRPFDAAGGSQTFTVSLNCRSSWQVVNKPGWVTVSPSGGTGSTVTLTVTASVNDSPDSRSGAILIRSPHVMGPLNGFSFTVSQAAASCAPSISPASQSIPQTGGSGTFAINVRSYCRWRIVNIPSWIILGRIEGVGPTSIGYQVHANTGDRRQGTLTVVGSTGNGFFNVSQDGRPCCIISPPPCTPKAPAADGKTYRLGSFNVPGGYVRHRNLLGEVTAITAQDAADALFKLVPGLAGSGVSFESVNLPGYYLRHNGFRIKLHSNDGTDVFRQDASFNVRCGLADANLVSLEAVNFPGYFLRHRGAELWIDSLGDDQHKRDATFMMESQSLSLPYFEIVAKHSGKCLDMDVARGGRSNGDGVQQWTCLGNANQRWQFVPTDDGHFRIVTAFSGKVLDIDNAGGIWVNGARAQQWDYLGGDNQKWRLVLTEDGYFRIVAKHSGKVLDIDNARGTSIDGARAQQWDYLGGDNQKWSLRPVAGEYEIVAKHSSKCLDIDLNPGATVNGAWAQQWTCLGGANQRWRFVAAGGAYFRLIASHSGKALDVDIAAGAPVDGAKVQQWDYLEGDNRKWRIVPTVDGYFQIVAKHSGRLLDVQGGPGAQHDGARAQQWYDWGGDNQKWSLRPVPRP
jgi:hypothetical protein